MRQQVERLERQREFAENFLRKEEVSLLKLCLASGELSLEEREKMVNPQLWSAHLEELELKAAMSFLPSATKLCVGHLLLGPASHHAPGNVEALASKMTGGGDNLRTSVLQDGMQADKISAQTSHPTITIEEDSAHPLTPEKKWLEGSSCLAKCPEDGTWCRARVVCQDSVKGDVSVKFVDKNIRAVVKPEDIVSSVDDLSEEEKNG